MNKEQFCQIVNELIQIQTDAEVVNTAFKKLDPEFNYISFGRYESLCLKTLKIAMNDDCDWIGYYIYECDCGKKTMKVTDKNGKKIPFKTVEDLYNMLVEK